MARILLALLVLAGLFLILKFVLSGSINSSEIVTDKVITGDISATISASGTVLPEFEELFLSPIASRIERVVASAGSQIKDGDTLLILDRETIKSEVQKLEDELELNKAQMEKQKLSLDKSIKELETNIAIRELQTKSLEAAFQNQKRLFDVGGGTQEELDKADLAVKIAHLEIKQMLQNRDNLKESSVVEIREKQLQIQIQQNKLEETRKKLIESVVIAHRVGVLTRIADQIGSEVRDKQQLATVSDLSSFKLKCTLSDAYAYKIQPGQNVLVKVNDSVLNGKIVTVMPAVSNGTVDFMVALKQKNHQSLRSNMKVEVYVVTSFKSNTQIVRNSGFYKGKDEQYIFVISNNIAERRMAKIGIYNFEYVEILSGAKAGEEIIISDMKDYEYRKELEVKQD